MRSALFVPGNKARMLERARALPADAVILDLEDGVPPGEKQSARECVRRALTEGPFRPHVILRVNAWSTGLTEDDLRQAFAPGVAAVCLPKVEAESDVQRLDGLLSGFERMRGLPPGGLDMFLMVETALGVLHAHPLACASRRVRGLCLGGEDLARELGAARTKDGAELAHARAHMLLAARAAGVLPLDTIYTNLNDTDGLVEEARRARDMGFSGMLLVHPAQIEPVHRAFAPDAGQVAHARRVLDAFQAAAAQGTGVIALDGQMIDAPVVARAREVLLRAGLSAP